jgi:ribonuclease D
LPDGRTHIFLKDTFNQPLFALLENLTIKKVANQINSDQDKLAEIGIPLKGMIELGHRAKERGIGDHLNPSLADLVRLLFSCELDKNTEIRVQEI